MKTRLAFACILFLVELSLSCGKSANPVIDFGGLFPVVVGGKWGYIDKAGKIVINPQFDGATRFAKGGLAEVYMAGRVGYIDKSGKLVINPQFNEGAAFG